jgi:H+/gluconate symporter-like permease
LSAALIALKVENPPQGFDAALNSWLGAVHGSAVSGTITGVSTMKIAIFAALGFVILACAAGGCFWHFHHDAAGEHMREIHESMWRAFHGK